MIYLKDLSKKDCLTAKKTKKKERKQMKMELRCEEDHSINGREYLLLELNVEEHLGYIAAVMDESQCEMAVLGKEREIVSEEFRLLKECEISPIHLREAVEDIIREQECANF